MPYAVITIDNIDKREAGYIHFRSSDQKAWNCNVPELIADLAEGVRYKIDYKETAPSGGRKYGSKYINRARLWEIEDGPNTWPDKEPYISPGGGSDWSDASHSGGKAVSKSTYDPEVGMRQTSANCATQFLAHQEGMSVDEFCLVFPVVAAKVLEFLKAMAPAAPITNEQAAASDTDIPF